MTPHPNFWHAREDGFVPSAVSASLRWSRSLLVVACLVIFAPALHAQESVITLDPAATKIEFTLAATMHTVHGTFKLKNGEIHWDPATGRVSGAIVIDATSGNTDNTSRDKNMHTQILESAKLPKILSPRRKSRVRFQKQDPLRSRCPASSASTARTIQLRSRFQCSRVRAGLCRLRRSSASPT